MANSTNPSEPSGGLKYDSSKPRMDLVSPIAMAELATVLTFGASKYAAHNWRKGIPFSRLLAAMERHLQAMKAGIDIDEESQLTHAAHLMCEAMFMCEFLHTAAGSNLDDRFRFNQETKDLLEGMLAGK